MASEVASFQPCLLLMKDRSSTQSPRAFWSAGESPERLWDNGLERLELYF